MVRSQLEMISTSQLDAIVQGNLAIQQTYGTHAEEHFHGSEFTESAAKINGWYRAAVLAANPSNPDWAAVAENFGHVLHTVQEFYANSNWSDLVAGNYLPAGSIIESGYSYWNDLTPFSLQSQGAVVKGNQTYQGVMLAEVKGIETSKPLTPFGKATAIGKSADSVGNTDLKIAWVEVAGLRYAAVVSGTFSAVSDNTPDQADFSQSELDKSSTSHPLYATAKSLAESQSRHELTRLFALVREYWGGNKQLLDAWIKDDDRTAFDELLKQTIDNGTSMQQLASQIKSGAVQQLTVVTHGFQPSNNDGDSLMKIAQALHHRSGGWLVDYDVPDQGERGFVQLHRLPDRLVNEVAGQSPQSRGSAVLLFDWAAESNEPSAGWTEAAADRLFGMLARLGVLEAGQKTDPTLTLHFIAHSFGSAVTSETIERLGHNGVAVDQMTLLDPHDFSQGILFDTEQNQSSVGAIPGYGATVWENVSFADVLYQTESLPDGRPIPGAVNYNVTNDTLVDGLLAHSQVWEELYLQTIIEPSSRSFGYRFSSAFQHEPTAPGTTPAPVVRPQAAFRQKPDGYAFNQNHEHTPIGIVQNPAIPDNFRASINWQPQLFNGDFSYLGDKYDIAPGFDNLIPGWTEHIAGTQGEVVKDGSQMRLRLNASGASRTHNPVYINSQLGVLEFELRVTNANVNDSLRIVVGNSVIGDMRLGESSSQFVRKRLIIPVDLREQTQAISFQLVPPQNSAIHAVVEIDNVALAVGGRTGDIVPVDLSVLHPEDTAFQTVGWDLVAETGAGSSTAMQVEQNALRDDLHLQVNGETVAFVIFSDRADVSAGNTGTPHASSGRLNLAPPVKNDLSSDRSVPDRGFQGTMRLWYRVGETAAAKIGNPSSLTTTLDGVVSEADRAAAIVSLNALLLINDNGDPKPTIPASAAIQSRNIIRNGQVATRQWLISSSDKTLNWVVVSTNGQLELFDARYVDIAILPGAGGVNDVEKITGQPITQFDNAKLQQRLRYWNYPDGNGELLVVDGIIGPLTKHAAGLFTASVVNGDFSEQEELSGIAANYANALNAPQWTELVKLTGDQFNLVEGPYIGLSPYFGTDWLTDTVRRGALAVKSGPSAIASQIGVNYISTKSGPGDNTPDHSSHDAGMAVDFVFSPGSGQSIVPNSHIVSLIKAMEQQAYPGVTLREVKVASADLVLALNQGRATPLATLDPAMGDRVHVRINPPPPLTATLSVDPVFSDDVESGLQDVLNWLDDLIKFDCNCSNLPALVNTDGDGDAASPPPTAVAEATGVSHALTGSNGSIASILASINSGGSLPTVYQLADDLTRTSVQWHANLPSSATVPSVSTFSATNSQSYNYTTPITIYDAVGSSHAADVYFVKLASANQWRVHLISNGVAVGTPQQITFSPSTQKIIAPANGEIVFDGYKPSDDLKPVNVHFNIEDLESHDRGFKPGWVAWGLGAQAVFNATTGDVALHFSMQGSGATGDRRFDFDDVLASKSMKLTGDLAANLSFSGVLDFTVYWKAISPLVPLKETMRVQLHEFKADVQVLADTIQAEGQISLLEGKIVDTGTINNPGTHNSYILVHGGFDFDFNDGQPIAISALDGLDVGEDYTLTVSCDLDGVLFYETTLAGHPIPGEMWLSLGLYSSKLVAQDPPVATANYSAATAFNLVINGDQNFLVNLPAAATQGNSGIVALASDLNASVQAALMGTTFEGKVKAVAIGTRIALVGQGNSVLSLKVVDLVDADGLLKLQQLGFVNNQAVEAPQSIAVEAKGALFNLIDQLKTLNPKQLADAAASLGSWLSSLSTTGPFQGALPLGGGSFGKFGNLGSELNTLLLNKFQEMELLAESNAAGTGNFTSSTEFNLTVDDTTFKVILPASVTAGNQSLNDLAVDLTGAIATALNANSLSGSVVALALNGRLALRTTRTGMRSLRVSNLEEPTVGRAGLERLGFTDGQTVDQLRLQSLQDLEQIFREALGVTSNQFGLEYDQQAKTIKVNVSFLKEALLDSQAIDLGKSFGNLTGISAPQSTVANDPTNKIELWRRTQSSFTFGIDLAPLGIGFSLTDGTTLSTLPTWGAGIEANKSRHLRITLSNGQGFDVNLASATTIGQVRSSIEQASLLSGQPRVSVAINPAGNGLTVSELNYSTVANSAAKFKIAAADGSKAALVLGLLGEDTSDTGIIQGRELHGQSLVNRLFVQNFNASIYVQATAPKINASANFGFAEVLINNGTGQATAQLDVALRDPNNDGRLYLSEMMASTNTANNNADGISLADVLGNPVLQCSLNLDLPVQLKTPITGLSLPATAGVVVTWQNIHLGTEPKIHLRDMDALKGFQNLSGVGLSDSLDIKQALGQSLDIKSNTFSAAGVETLVPELRFVFRDGTTKSVDLDAIEALSSGVARKSIRSFGDLRDAIGRQTGGRASVSYSLDGRSLVVTDTTTGNGNFTISDFEGASNIGLLGLSTPHTKGVISGEPIYQPSVLDALRRVADLLRSFTDIDALRVAIPGTKVSLSELLDLATRLDQSIDDIQDRGIKSLGELEQALRDKLGLSADSFAFGYEANALKIVLKLFRSTGAQTLGLNFDLGGSLGSLVDAKGKAKITANADATLVIAVGIDLSQPKLLRPFLYTNDDGQSLLERGTSFQVQASVRTPEPIAMSVAIGPLSAAIKQGSFVLDADGIAATTAPATLMARVRDTTGTGRRYLDNLGASALTTTFAGAANMVLPTYIPASATTALGNITLSAPNLLNPASFSIQTPDFTEAINGFNPLNDLSSFLDGWDGVLGLLETQIAKKLTAIKLPVVGSQLNRLTEFLSDLRTINLVGGSAENVRLSLFNALNSKGLLRDRNNDGSKNIDDVQLVTGAGAIPDFVQYNLSLGSNLITLAQNLKFDLGLPGLGLKLNQDVFFNLNAAFRFDLGIGIDRNGGVYIALDPTKKDDVHLEFNAEVLNPSISANLGFLKLTVDNLATKAAGELDLDITPKSNGRLRLGELFGAPVSTSFTGNVLEGPQHNQDNNKAVLLDWQLTASFGNDGNMPKLRTRLGIDWKIDAFSDLSKAPNVSFGEVQLDVGSFLGNFLGPIVENVNRVLDPVRPVIKVLTEPIPVISDLAGPTTLLDIADFFGYGDYNKFIYAARDISELATTLRGIGKDENWVTLGSFTVDGKLALSSRARGQLSAKPQLQQTIDTIQSQMDANPQQSSAFKSSVGFAGGGGFKFPIFENPASAFELLLGRDITLFGYDMPAFQAYFEYTQFYPIFGPLGARFTGSVSATVDFAFGYDTKGLRDYASDGYNDLSLIKRGFFISDTASVDGRGPDVPELTLSGALTAAGEVNVAVARAGVGGGIFLDVFFDLNDPDHDGKVRFNELQANWDLGPLHVFDVTGRLTAKLFAYFEIGIKVLGKYKRIAGKDWELAETVLLDYTLPRPETSGPPALATPDGTSLRLVTSESADQFTISKVGTEIVVFSQGREVKYNGYTKVLFDGKGGNDRLTVLDDANIEVEADGGAGDDVITTGGSLARVLGGAGKDVIQLGSGGGYVDGGADNDSITGSDANDVLIGGTGQDVINGNGGNDLIFGDNVTYTGTWSGNPRQGLRGVVVTLLAGGAVDRIYAGDGDDLIYAGDGNDFVEGGRGNDWLEGNAGDDDLDGGADDDVIIGGIGSDAIDGNRGQDLLIGDSVTIAGNWSGTPSSPGVTLTAHSGTGNDRILGDRGDDLIYAGGGLDFADSGIGDDIVFGQGGADEIHLGAGDDWADGGDGNDKLYGDSGRDELRGGDNDDLLVAGARIGDWKQLGESNFIIGGLGNDTIYGGQDKDILIGDVATVSSTTWSGDPALPVLQVSDESGTGNDVIYGGSGSNFIVGGLGRDRILAGKTVDGGGRTIDRNLIYGDQANTDDGTTAETDADQIFGDIGPDVIHAGSGSDTVAALGGNNTIYLGAGNNSATSGSGDDKIYATTGQNTIRDDGGDNTIQIAGGNNRIRTGNGIDQISTGSGNDVIESGNGVKTITSQGGNNVINVGDALATIRLGVSESNSVTGTGNNSITVRHGTKFIRISGGDNIISLGNGDVELVTGSGKDIITAGQGIKTVLAGAGNNTITLGGGDSVVVTASGNDTITTGDGNDRIFTTGGTNSIQAGAGNDFIQTGAGADLVIGGAGDDIILAGDGIDTLRGSAGRDFIVAGRGNDLVDGGDGEDVLFAGQLPSFGNWTTGNFASLPTWTQIQTTL